MKSRRRSGKADPDIGTSKIVIGRDLSTFEETNTRIHTLVEILNDKGLINSKEYESRVVMRLHEIS